MTFDYAARLAELALALRTRDWRAVSATMELVTWHTLGLLQEGGRMECADWREQLKGVERAVREIDAGDDERLTVVSGELLALTNMLGYAGTNHYPTAVVAQLTDPARKQALGAMLRGKDLVDALSDAGIEDREEAATVASDLLAGHLARYDETEERYRPSALTRTLVFDYAS